MQLVSFLNKPLSFEAKAKKNLEVTLDTDILSNEY